VGDVDTVVLKLADVVEEVDGVGVIEAVSEAVGEGDAVCEAVSLPLSDAAGVGKALAPSESEALASADAVGDGEAVGDGVEVGVSLSVCVPVGVGVVEEVGADVWLGVAAEEPVPEALEPLLNDAVGDSVAVKVSDTEAERVTCTAGRDGEAAAVGEARAEALVAPVEETL
jgi:hypothetical protein